MWKYCVASEICRAIFVAGGNEEVMNSLEGGNNMGGDWSLKRKDTNYTKTGNEKCRSVIGVEREMWVNPLPFAGNKRYGAEEWPGKIIVIGG